MVNQEGSKKSLTLDGLKSKGFSEKLYWRGTFEDFLEIAAEHPLVAESAHQKMYRSAMVHGFRQTSWLGIQHPHYNLFDDPIEDGKDAVFGIDIHLAKLISKFRAAAERRGQEDRFILLHGPVGSSKSTITRLLKKNLCWFTTTDDGAYYSYSWVVDPSDHEGRLILGLMDEADGNEKACPCHEIPFKLLPEDTRRQTEEVLNDIVLEKYGKNGEFPEDKSIKIDGVLCPFCRQVFNSLVERHNGDWKAVLSKYIRVRRIVFSEEDRVGVGSFRPKDEKNQDSTELSGDINYRKIAQIGSESDPRAFNFDGEFQVSGGGMFYVEEVCKLDKAFLYDFLGATQEHEIKPKRFRVMSVDTVLIGSTNNPEFEKLVNDDTMEAFRDRTTKIDIPYVIRVSEEMKIY
ncbi:MAG: serine protein kinase, partial [Candidatus Vogelbacteria bacterium]|nr:serine protein kinase [Candidatus Vogelbacteria bacterium]